MTEEEVYDQHYDWIRNRFGKHAADIANIGWFVDEVEGVIGTKVYGHGIVTTALATGELTYEETTSV